MAAGMLDLALEFDAARSPPLRGPAPKHVVVKAGRTTEIAIPLRETVNVRGVLREKGTNRPIVGAKVILNSYYGGDRFTMADAAGRFAGRILREVNQPFGWPIRSRSLLHAGRPGGDPPEYASARGRRAGDAADRAAARRGGSGRGRRRGRQGRRRRRGRGDLGFGRGKVPGVAARTPTGPATSHSTASIRSPS